MPACHILWQFSGRLLTLKNTSLPDVFLYRATSHNVVQSCCISLMVLWVPLHGHRYNQSVHCCRIPGPPVYGTLLCLAAPAAAGHN